MLEKTTYINELYAMYGPLLTAKQQTYLTYYYQDDLSLGEIAELSQVSRQAVYDQVKRAETMLLEYESKLGFLQETKSRQAIYEALQSYLKRKYATDEQLQAYFDQLVQLEESD